MKGTELVSIVDTIKDELSSTYANYCFDASKCVIKKPYTSIIMVDKDITLQVIYIPYTCMLIVSDDFAVFAVARSMESCAHGEVFEKLYVFGPEDESVLVYVEKILHIGGVTQYIHNDKELEDIFTSSEFSMKTLFDYFEGIHQTRDLGNYPTNIGIFDEFINQK